MVLGSAAAKPRASPTIRIGSAQWHVADSVSGRWESRSRNLAFGGELYLRLTLEQRGDSLTGTLVLEYRDNADEAPKSLAGAFSGDRFKLADRGGFVQLFGSLRNGKLETRIVPGRAAEASAFNATFTRAP